jgi:hypothetical protein
MCPASGNIDSQPSDDAKLERCCRLAAVELAAVTLQRRRLRTEEPEDEEFDLRWWVDQQFLILSLSRLRRTTHLLRGTRYETDDIRSALESFDANTPSLTIMRNIGEHADEYAIDSPKRHVKTVDRRQLEVGSWDGQTFRWLEHELTVDAALAAAQALHRALHTTQIIAATATSS